MNEALLIIDVQNDYFPNGKNELYQPNEALINIKSLLTQFRELGKPVIHVQHISSADGSFFLPNTYGVEIHPTLQPLDNETLISKHYPNSFQQTDLHSVLTDLHIDHLVVCGMMTHMCIDTTVRSSKDLGYSVTLIEDACATKDLAWNNQRIDAEVVQHVYMASLHSMFANVMSTDDYISKFKRIHI